MVTQKTIGSTEPEQGCMGAGLRLPHQHGHCTARALSPQWSHSASCMTLPHTHIYTVCRITHTADETITAALVPPAVPPCSTLEQEKQVSDKSGRDEGEFMSSCFNTGQCCLCSTGSSSRFNCEFKLGECSQDFSFYSCV